MVRKKRKEEKHEYKPTKRQLSHLQKQKRRQRLITIIGSVVIAGVVLLLGIGFVTQWFVPVYLQLQKPVLEIDGKKYNVEYYIEALKFYSGSNINAVLSNLDGVLDTIERYELLTQAALEMGYGVTDSEVKDAIGNLGIEDNKATRDYITYQILLGKVREGEFAGQVPNTTEHRNLLAMFVESQGAAEEILVAIEAGGDFSELAADSLDSYTASMDGEVGWRINGVLDGLLDSDVMDDAVFDVEEGAWMIVGDSNKYKDIGYWLIELLERNETDNTVHVRAMLLSSEEEALSVRQMLEEGGNFGELALQYSQIISVDENHGDLGFISTTSSNFTDVFVNYVFNEENELNSLSEPLFDDVGLSTTGGYWVFKVDGIEERDVDDENRQLLVGAALNKWAEGVVDGSTAEVVNYLDDDIKLFALERISEGK